MTLEHTGAPHVLLVDDNPDQLRLLVEALREQSYRLTVAFDGIQGYTRAVAMMPDLILLDVRMPRRDGLATARMLKANTATEHIPILFLTAAGDLEDRLSGLRLGAVDYILKPFLPEEVVERVRIHLELSGKAAASSDTAGTSADPVPHEQVTDQDAGGADRVLQRAAARIVLGRLDRPPKASELAVSLGVSERRISAAFESCKGMSLFEFIRRERMRKAARLLTRTRLNIVDIAAEIGYSSAANFATAFREFWGRTPSAFRNNDDIDAV